MRKRKYSRKVSDVEDASSADFSSTASVDSRESAYLDIWSKLFHRSENGGDVPEGLPSELSFSDYGVTLRTSCLDIARRAQVQIRRTTRLVRRHPQMLLWSVAVFALFSIAGHFIIWNVSQSVVIDKTTEAAELAKTSVEAFSDALDRAILPLFSLAQFVFEIDEFHGLPLRIGQVGTEWALPLLPPKVEGDHPTHRNVTGVCDDPQLMHRFSEIAATIKRNSKMDGVLVNLQLAPAATVCLLHPLNNTEDFEEGIYLDSTGAIGHDLLNDPKRKFIAEATIPANRVVTAGPLSLTQCKGCHPAVERAFIARLPIYMDEYNITVGGVDYNAWGFAVALINWQELIDRSNIVSMFENLGMGFVLTRTDTKYDPTSDTYEERLVSLASYREDLLVPDSSISIDLETTDNQWEIMVGFTNGLEPKWVPGARAFVSILSVCVFWLVFFVLSSRQAHGNLLRDIFPPKALRKLNRDEVVVEEYLTPTVFFSDIVGYTTLSSEMSAMEVMEMLSAFYAKMDALAEEYDVYKLETVGDAYMVVGGAPFRCSGPEGAQKVARFALAAMEMVETFVAPSGLQIYIRAGLNSGPLVAGVVGTKKPHYTVFGNTVNLASRMESTSIRMKIQCSPTTHQFLNDAPEFKFDMTSRGPIKVKGKGEINTWWINAATPRLSREGSPS